MKYKILKDKGNDHNGKPVYPIVKARDFAEVRNLEEAVRISIVQKCQNQGARTTPEEELERLLREWEK